MAKMQQNPFSPQLSRRIIASARGLACSTFAGIANIENELRDVSTIGKQHTLPIRSSTKGSEVKYDRVRKPSRRGSGSSGSSFRTKKVSFAFDEEDMVSGSGSPKLELTHFDKPTTWHLDQDQDAFLRDDESLQQDENIHGTFEEVWNTTNFQNALRRLSQVARHISSKGQEQSATRNSQEFDPDVYLQQVSRLHVIGLEQQEQNYHNHIIQHHQHQHQHRYQPVLTPQQQQHGYHKHPGSLQETHHKVGLDPNQQIKHKAEYTCCPSFACHHHHAPNPANKKIVLGDVRRSCIHLCCDFVSTTAEEWYDHLANAHSGQPRTSVQELEHQVLLRERQGLETSVWPPRHCDRCANEALETCHDGADGPCVKCACGRHLGKVEVIRKFEENNHI